MIDEETHALLRKELKGEDLTKEEMSHVDGFFEMRGNEDD